MIISHTHKFIFIHCRKVAGSSVAAFLARHLGPDDLMVDSWGDALKNGARYNARVLREVLCSPKGIAKLAALSVDRLRVRKAPSLSIIGDAYKKIYNDKMGDRATFPQAVTVQSWAPREWGSYFKFCFVRNPYSRAVSDYRWRVRHPSRKHIDFTEFLSRVADPGRPDAEGVVPHPRDNWGLYTINDRVAVDYVGRMESLSADMEKICRHISLPFSEGDLPHFKKFRGISGDYKACYSGPDRELAYSAYRKEIDYFGYSFE